MRCVYQMDENFYCNITKSLWEVEANIIAILEKEKEI